LIHLSIILQNQSQTTLPEALVIALISLAVFAGILVLAWPSLQENNIFKKGRLYNYGKGEHAKIYLRARERDTLAFTIVANLTGLALFIYLAIQIHLQGNNYHVTDIDRLPLRLFGLGLFCTFCLFVYCLFGELELDLIRNFTYSLKVWLTGLFASPLVLFVLNMGKITQGKYLLYLYARTVVLASGIGLFTFLVLIFGVHYFTAKPLHIRTKRKKIALLTQVSVLLSVLIAGLTVQATINWFYTWLTYALIIGLCTRFYNMNTTVYTDAVFYEAEVVD
jgi:hypothetical protein